MFLKKLELKGFKSFPEKIALEFGKGITAVVGPNGSGKSNISDAIRWVLGEQSVKNLRGSNKMEDVIFAGTQNRTKLGFAEVSMTVDNSDFRLNAEYNEVVITRRLFRSGESEFLINGSQCRLKDIHELFMDTGIGREGYSIIGQGRIDEILSSKSEDRRLLFEEAVGIVKFKTRRGEAERKLEREKQNLIRIDDIISEIEKQLSPLEIQAEKTKKYLVLTERLKIIQINLFVQELKKIEKDIKKIEENKVISQNELAKEEEKFQNSNNRKKQIEFQISELEKQTELVNNETVECRSNFEQKENDIKLINQQIEYIKNDIKRIQSDIFKYDETIKTKKETIGFKNSEKKSASLKLQVKNNEYLKLKSDFEFIDSKLAEKEEKIDKINDEIINKIHTVGEIGAEYEKTAATISQLLIRKNQLREEYDFSKSQVNDKKIHFEALKIQLSDNTLKQNKIKDELSKLENEKKGVESEISRKKSERNSIAGNLQESSSRFRVLSELEKDFEGYYGSVKAILKEKENLNPLFKGVCGAVGELISVEQKYETAIEIAVGGFVQNIVTENENDAQKAIEYLKKNNKGRATFLPMTAIKPRELGNEKSRILSEDGIIGIAKDIISYDRKYENIMSNILGKVIICSDLSVAIAFSKKYYYSYKVVTLSGEVVNPGGALTGGSINKKSAGIFSRTREIKTLNDKIGILKLNLSKIESEINILQKENLEIFQIIENEKSESHNLFLEKNDIQNKISQTELYINELYQKNNSINCDIEKISKDIEKNKILADSLEQSKNKIEKEIADVRQSLAGFQDEMQSEKDSRNDRNNLLTQIKIEITEIEHSVRLNQSEIERLLSEIKETETYKENALNEISEFENSTSEKQNSIVIMKKEVEKIKEKYINKQKEFDNLNAEKISITEKANKIQKYCIETLDTIANIKAERERLEIFLGQAEEKKTRICNEMWDKYEITEASAQRVEKLDYPASKIQIEEIRIKGQIKDMGTVNTDAVNEFKAVKERFEFLTNQRQDIVQAEENLKNIISELTELMENQFKEQFRLINENFGIVFAEIFGGGKGFLSLSNEGDVLNSGIEIVAQPPGKTVQSMTLLSGGERALTAIALLFAILKMKPSPFCILDEIEAALDDANVKRYADYLKDFSKETQFIIITHRKGSMEVADTLYGVTMQEQGVSKLVSVKFDEPVKASVV